MFNNYLPIPYHSHDKIISEVSNLGAVYLGDINAALDVPLLRSLKIQTVITAADGLEHVRFSEPDIVHIRYPLYDLQTERISRFFEENYKNIEQGRMKGAVLVHCAAGISRSATLLISYLMRRESWAFKKAINFVRQRRPVICPNLGFQRQLKQYERLITVKPRAFSIRVGPKSSDQPRQHNQQKSSLPQISSSLNRTQLRLNQLHTRQMPRKDIFIDQKLDLQNNLIISHFKNNSSGRSLLPHSSQELPPRRKQSREPLINANELKRLTMLKLGHFSIKQPERPSFIALPASKKKPIE